MLYSEYRWHILLHWKVTSNYSWAQNFSWMSGKGDFLPCLRMFLVLELGIVGGVCLKVQHSHTGNTQTMRKRRYGDCKLLGQFHFKLGKRSCMAINFFNKLSELHHRQTDRQQTLNKMSNFSLMVSLRCLNSSPEMIIFPLYENHLCCQHRQCFLNIALNSSPISNKF